MAEMDESEEEEEEEEQENEHEEEKPADQAPAASQKAADFDWGAPASQPASQKATDFDWGTPATNTKSEDTSSAMDWGSALSDPFSRLSKKEEDDEPPSFSVMSSDSDSSSDDEGLVMKQVSSECSMHDELLQRSVSWYICQTTYNFLEF